MADSYAQSVADGNTQVFTIPFPYLNASHVQVYLNGIQQLTPKDFVWLNAGAIQFFGKPLEGVVVLFQRVTSPDSALVTYQNGSNLTAAELNTATLQNFYRTQELQDQLSQYISGGVTYFSSNGSYTGLSPQELIDAVSAGILASDLAVSLQQQINDIATNGQTILQNTTDIATETTQRTSGDSSLASVLALIGAKNSAGDAFIIDTSTAMVDSTTSLADKFTQVQSDISGNTAAIQTEQSARASGDSANATAVTTLQTTVGANTALIQTQATSINGLSAQYTVKVDVNGHVAGFGLASEPVNGTLVSSFIVNANQFAVIDPGNGLNTPTVPFSIVGGVVYMRSVVIQDALIQDMTITKLTQGSLNADMEIGTGRVIWDNGAFMKVIGVGFGSSNQFLEWFGPHQAAPFTGCTESNAIAYLKTDGDAYFGGALLAGKLFASAQGVLAGPNNVCDLGPYSSNGGIITITASASIAGETHFTGDSTGVSQYNAVESTFTNPVFTVVLSRSVGGGSFADVATWGITGSWSSLAPIDTPGEETPGFYSQSAAGSFTYTDDLKVAQTREYKLRFTQYANVNSAGASTGTSLTSVE